VRAPNPTYDAIRTRRVTRRMSDEPVDPDDFALVLESARYAPNAGNRRLQPVVPVTDPAMLRLVRMMSPGMIPRPTAAIVVCLDTERAAGFGFRPGTPGLYVDVGTTAATLLLAAHSLGLASCPVTSFSRAGVARLLGLGAGVVPQLVVCLGHAAATQPDALSPLR
jgi:nitroreductase